MAAVVAAGLAAQPAVAGTSATLLQNYSSYLLPESSESGGPDDAEIAFRSAAGLYTGIELQALSRFDANSILFKNGIVMAGRNSMGNMVTGVAITFTNTNSTRVVRPVVTSTILAAGLGVFVTDGLLNPNAANPLGACSTNALSNCGLITANGIEQLRRIGRGPSYFSNSVASFDFDVSVGGSTIYSMTGKMGIDAGGSFFEEWSLGKLDPATGALVVTTGAVPTTLNNFRQTVNGGAWGQGYAWDDTDVKIALPNALNPGQSVTAIYTVATSTQLGGAFGLTIGTGPDRSVSHIGYSAFGDPTGGDNPISPDLCAAGDSQCQINLSTTGRLNFPGSTLFTDPGTGEQSLVANTTEVFNPTTNEYDLVADLTGGVNIEGPPAPPPPPVGGIPEPGSWAMLIAGFGLTGSAMRRRRTMVTG